jgi:hypothetical protein
LRLKDVPKHIPVSSATRYLSYGVEVGLLKHEDGVYQLTDRYTKPFRNIASYIKAWSESSADEELETQFISAKMEKQEKRGGKVKKEVVEEQKQENKS